MQKVTPEPAPTCWRDIMGTSQYPFVPMPKTYDRAYFDKWYRDPRHSVASLGELKRKIAMVVAQAEYYLGRPIRNVLDVGCGEATWRAPLRALPSAHRCGPCLPARCTLSPAG